jgi:transposase-like protein
MSEETTSGRRRKRRLLSPEQKWEIFLEVTSRELTQADAARKWRVDTSVVIKVRRDAKDAALAAFAASRPGRSRDPRDAQIEALQVEAGQLIEAIKEQAIELALLRGKARWA